MVIRSATRETVAHHQIGPLRRGAGPVQKASCLLLTGAVVAVGVLGCEGTAGMAPTAGVTPASLPSPRPSPSLSPLRISTPTLSPTSAPTPTPTAIPTAVPTASAKPGFYSTGSMTAGRFGPTATLLPDGRVLIAGGTSATDLASAELYDPKTGTFSPTGSMAAGHGQGQTATLLQNGKVLMTGGRGDSAAGSAELYDPSSGTFSLTGPLVNLVSTASPLRCLTVLS